ncbi:MAG: fructose-6-phosphate aldolase [Selenomonadaceae bacterium]|nr:fructose-6-phosphate aldolase [Selenomonadaceae bacterium]
MKLLIDDARLDEIKKIYEFFPVSGVTTNPTILSKVGGNPFDTLKKIRGFIGEEADLHVQAVNRRAEKIVDEAKHIVEVLGANTYVKIPAVPEGFKAMKILVETSEILITATAIYTPMQAFIAGQCGASYAAPYVNRIDNMGFNGLTVAKEIQQIFSSNRMETEVIAASFKNSQQVLELCKCGISAATIAPEIFFALIKNSAINDAVENFIADFESFAGKDKSMLDFK